jgi:UDP-galactopyranose mutase
MPPPPTFVAPQVVLSSRAPAYATPHRVPESPPLVVYSQLRWSSVLQRPQQLMSRIARRRSVVFVEEPTLGERARWQLRRPAHDLVVATPVTNVAAAGFCDAQLLVLAPLLAKLLRWSNIGPHTAWLFTPMAWPLARAQEPDTVVYDSSDELASSGGNAGLAMLERELLANATLVFASGPSLYRAKAALHPRVRCVPSSVDARHFARRSGWTPPDQARLPRPRLGYCGVIDGRVDTGLLARLADSHPEWQLVMLGPVAGVSPDSLPKRPNIHFLGARRHEDLPSYLAGWDVCLLPFAQHDAALINPTQALEYMAAELPIVSTPIRDVAEPFGKIVTVAEASDFAAACERAMAAPLRERRARVGRMRRVLSRRSWDATVSAMLRELAEVEPAWEGPLCASDRSESAC